MADHEQNIRTKEQASSYLYFSSIYFVSIGVLFLWGYWTTFNVNILEYLSLTDVVKYTAFPIAISVISSGVSAAFGGIIGNSINSIAGQDGAKNSRLGLSIRKFVSKLSPLPMVLYLCGTVWLWLFGPTYKWLLLPFLIAVPLVSFAMKHGLFATLIRHDGNRLAVMLVLATLPGLSYNQGFVKATSILEGESFSYVASKVEGVDVGDNAPPNERPRFLGHAGDFLFFFLPDKEALVIRHIDATMTLQLKQFTSPRQIAPHSDSASKNGAPINR